MTAAPQAPKKALVLSGGGADGAYMVGVLKALISGLSPSTSYRPLDPEILTGTSVGAYNSAVLTSLWDEFGITSVANLESIWLDVLSGPDPHTNGFYRIRADPSRLLDPRHWLPDPLGPLGRLILDSATLGTDGLQRLVHLTTAWDESLQQRFVELFNLSSFVTCDPFDQSIRDTIRFDKIRSTSKILKVVATDWVNGRIRCFDNLEMTDEIGRQALLASAAIPGFLPPRAVGSQLFVDGGVLLNTPLTPALDAGADELHVIYLDPVISKIPLAHVKNTGDTFYRMFQIMWAAAVNDDIEDAKSINRGLEIIERIPRSGELTAEETKAFILVAGMIADRLEHIAYRPLVIHRYHPREDLGGDLGFLNFGRERLRGLIEKGFNDTVHHDCAIARCVLPDSAEGAADGR